MKYRRLYDLRHDNDWKQKDVSEKLHISQRAYSYYETGERSIPPEILCALADIYDVSVDYLLGRTDDKGKKDKKEQDK